MSYNLQKRNENNDENCVSLSFHEILLHRSDINLIRRNDWLNDQIISFYFEYLEKIIYDNMKEYFLFVSPEVTQCIKIVPENDVNIFLTPLNAKNKEYIFFPLNNNETTDSGGTHCSLLVFSRNDNTFYHYDSINSTNKSNCRNFVLGIKKSLNCPQVIITNVPCLQQQNGYDCGIHVLCMVDLLCNHIIRTGHIQGAEFLNYATVQSKRNELLFIIEELGGKV